MMVISPYTLAQDKDDVILVKVVGFGVGISKSCGDFIRETEGQQKDVAVVYNGSQYYPAHTHYAEWLAGYLTAYSCFYDSYHDGVLTKDINVNDALLWVRNYCEKHPLDHISDGIAPLITELKNRNGKH